jgi:hypothetical protein
MSYRPDNIFGGTQVVSLVEVRGKNNVNPHDVVGSLIHPVRPLLKSLNGKSCAALDALLVRERLKGSGQLATG